MQDVFVNQLVVLREHVTLHTLTGQTLAYQNHLAFRQRQTSPAGERGDLVGSCRGKQKGTKDCIGRPSSQTAERVVRNIHQKAGWF